MPRGKSRNRKPKQGNPPPRDPEHETARGMPSYGPAGKAKFGEAEREEVLEKVARWDRMGWSQYDIARALQVSQPTARKFVQTIKLRYREASLAQHGELVEEKIEQLRDIMIEAWAAWHKSKLDRMRSTEEDGLRVERDELAEERALIEATGGDGRKVRPLKAKEAKTTRQVVGLAGRDGEKRQDGHGPPRVVMKKIKEVRVREPQCGDPQYLRLVIDCLKEISTLRGLYPVKKIDATVQTIDWSVFADSLPDDGVVPDEVEARIQRALALGMAEKEKRGEVIHVEAEPREAP